jgi:hypothetical protein
MSVRSVEDESLKVQFAYAFDLRSHFEVGIEVVTNAILTFEKAYLRIEVRPDLSVIQPIALIMEHAAEVRLT